MKTKIILLFTLISINLHSQIDIGDFDIQTTRITPKMMSLICDEELEMMRNEIFARKGYTFSNPKYKKAFEACHWYHPLGDNSKVKLSDVETESTSNLKKEEERRAKRKTAIIDYFNTLNKKTIVENILTRRASCSPLFANA